jgi:hypothetical protein
VLNTILYRIVFIECQKNTKNAIFVLALYLLSLLLHTSKGNEMEKKHPVNFRLTPRRHERLQKAATAADVSMTAFLEAAIDEKIDRDGRGLREIEERKNV